MVKPLPISLHQDPAQQAGDLPARTDPLSEFRFVTALRSAALASVGGAKKLTLWMRLFGTPGIEPVWTMEGPGHDDYVQEARGYRDAFVKLSQKMNSPKTAQLSYYVNRIASFLEYHESGNEQEKSTNIRVLGQWKMIKPKDLDFILNDASLRPEWQELAKTSVATELRQTLTELRAIYVNLTF